MTVHWKFDCSGNIPNKSTCELSTSNYVLADIKSETPRNLQENHGLYRNWKEGALTNVLYSPIVHVSHPEKYSVIESPCASIRINLPSVCHWCEGILPSSAFINWKVMFSQASVSHSV